MEEKELNLMYSVSELIKEGTTKFINELLVDANNQTGAKLELERTDLGERKDTLFRLIDMSTVNAVSVITPFTNILLVIQVIANANENLGANPQQVTNAVAYSLMGKGEEVTPTSMMVELLRLTSEGIFDDKEYVDSVTKVYNEEVAKLTQ